jgi:integrase
VHNLPERQGGIGRALTAEERQRLFDAAASNQEWEHVYCAAIVAANTSMRPVEVKHLRRCDVDLAKKLLYVRRSKNETGHRVIPLNAPAIKALPRMFERADLLGHAEPEHYLWPACQWGRFDPTQPMLKWDTAWRALREAAGLPGFRFHDLRHTIITELAEMGVADHVLESITGHLTRRMLEHYSHIRIDAKRQALDALDEQRKRGAPDAEISADTVLTQNQSSFMGAGPRRCVRGARLHRPSRRHRSSDRGPSVLARARRERTPSKLSDKLRSLHGEG